MAQQQVKVEDIIAIAMNGDRGKCLEGGMDDYISKSMDINKLAKAFSKYNKKPSKWQKQFRLRAVSKRRHT